MTPWKLDRWGAGPSRLRQRGRGRWHASLALSSTHDAIGREGGVHVGIVTGEDPVQEEARTGSSRAPWRRARVLIRLGAPILVTAVPASWGLASPRRSASRYSPSEDGHPSPSPAGESLQPGIRSFTRLISRSSSCLALSAATGPGCRSMTSRALGASATVPKSPPRLP